MVVQLVVVRRTVRQHAVCRIVRIFHVTEQLVDGVATNLNYLSAVEGQLADVQIGHACHVVVVVHPMPETTITAFGLVERGWERAVLHPVLALRDTHLGEAHVIMETFDGEVDAHFGCQLSQQGVERLFVSTDVTGDEEQIPYVGEHLHLRPPTA